MVVTDGAIAMTDESKSKDAELSVRVVAIDPASPDPEVIRDAAERLKRGALVAFPTETVYGLGARGLHAGEVRAIFEAKGRPSAHPIILHVDGEAMARSIASVWSEAASRFAKAFWPGPLTLVVPRKEGVVPDAVTGGLSTVGIRAPAHPVALALIRAACEPLAAPSANAHTHVSPTTAAHVVRSLGDRTNDLLVLDAGPCAHGIESTVLDLSGDHPRVLRPGAASLAELRAIDPSVAYDEASSPATTIADNDAPRASPGLASKHYAPRGRVVLVPRGSMMDAIATELRRPARPIAVIVATAEGRRAASAMGGVTHTIELPDDPAGYGHHVFAALHSMEELGAAVILIERVPADDPAWWAVRDRLERASH